jgi:hypothetical protein
MAENSTRQSEPASQQNMAELLSRNGSAQVGIMVGIVTTISQPFAQADILGIEPLIVAIIVSFLLATY